MMTNKFNASKKSSNNDPIFDQLFEVIFPIENEILSEMVYKMDKHSITFNLNLDDNNRLLPLKELIALSVNEGDLRVNMHRQDGKIFLSKVYHECKYWPNFDILHYHNYMSSGIKEMGVSFFWQTVDLYDENNKLIDVKPR